MPKIYILPNEHEGIAPHIISFDTPAPGLVSARVAREIANLLKRMERQVGYFSDSANDISNVTLDGEQHW
jgi:hypothetical protein